MCVGGIERAVHAIVREAKVTYPNLDTSTLVYELLERKRCSTLLEWPGTCTAFFTLDINCRVSSMDGHHQMPCLIVKPASLTAPLIDIRFCSHTLPSASMVLSTPRLVEGPQVFDWISEQGELLYQRQCISKGFWDRYLLSIHYSLFDSQGDQSQTTFIAGKASTNSTISNPEPRNPLAHALLEGSGGDLGLQHRGGYSSVTSWYFSQ